MKKILFSLTVFMLSSLSFLSCSSDDEETNSTKSFYKIEISNTENCKYYDETIVLQINDEQAKSVNITNTQDFEVLFDMEVVKTLRHTAKSKEQSVYTTSQAILGITLALGYNFNEDIETVGKNGKPSFSSTIKVYKNDKLIDTQNYTINKDNAAFTTITLNYHN